MLGVIEKYAMKSLRTIAVAFKELDVHHEIVDSLTDEFLDKNLTLIGVVGIKDPIRPDVPMAIK